MKTIEFEVVVSDAKKLDRGDPINKLKIIGR